MSILPSLKCAATTYDAGSRRTSATINGVATTFSYDRADQLVEQTVASASTNFTYDVYGNLLERAVAGSDPTVYAYDPADRLIGFTPDGGDPVTYTLDAAGRRWTRSVDGVLDATYTYHAAGNQVSRIVSGALTTDAAFDAAGTRLATATSASGFGWLLADLHGNAAATAADDFSAIDNAFRYDPYGQLIDSVTDTLPTPWRFGGRLHLDPDGATDLYDWQARTYDPGLGAFTSLDSVTGSVESPLTLNRYLFTHANPVSLIDPDGHCVHCGYRMKDYDQRPYRPPAPPPPPPSTVIVKNADTIGSSPPNTFELKTEDDFDTHEDYVRYVMDPQVGEAILARIELELVPMAELPAWATAAQKHLCYIDLDLCALSAPKLADFLTRGQIDFALQQGIRGDWAMLVFGLTASGMPAGKEGPAPGGPRFVNGAGQTGSGQRPTLSQVQLNRQQGLAAEAQYLRQTPGSTAGGYFNVPGRGRRFVDAQTQSGQNIEVKTGIQRLTARNRQQLAKDQWITENAPHVTGTEWHFYMGKGGAGPAPDLANALQHAGIPFSVHRPDGSVAFGWP